MTKEQHLNMFDELIGSQLSSVEFVQDYLQLRFDGPTINVNNPLTVKTEQAKITSWNEGFRDILCGQIAKIVDNVYFESEKELKIVFTDISQISISLLKVDYTSPEGIYAHGFTNDQSFTG
jgi:hypothetical protein